MLVNLFLEDLSMHSIGDAGANMNFCGREIRNRFCAKFWVPQDVLFL